MDWAVTSTLPAKQVAQRFARIPFSVNQHDLAWIDRLDETGDLVAVGVSGKRILFDAAFDIERLPRNRYLACFGLGQTQELPSRRFFILIAGDRDAITFVLDNMLGVESARTAGQHSRTRNDHARIAGENLLAFRGCRDLA